MISFIQSNYAGFGSGICIPDTGIHLQNRGAGFSLNPKSANVAGAKKRPFHTIIPGFLTRNDQPVLSWCDGWSYASSGSHSINLSQNFGHKIHKRLTHHVGVLSEENKWQLKLPCQQTIKR